MSAETKSADFSPLRTFFWPVHRYELKKLIPMLLIFFLLSFDYNILRCLKDTLIITAEHSGAEVIPFIKVWVMFPTSVLMTFIFIRLSNRFSRETVFYVMLSLFLLYFFVFTFFIYPIRDSLHQDTTAEMLQTLLPAGCKGFIAMYRYWIFTSFYVMSELWGNIVLFLLFWGFANQITKIDEAKRFYGLFGVGTNFSGIAAGHVSILIASFSFASEAIDADPWQTSLTQLTTLVLIAGLLAMALFYYINRVTMRDPRLIPQDSELKKTEKAKLSMRENIKYLFTSKYIICLTIIVIAYNIIINLVEILWKQEVRELNPNPLAYNTYMNEVTIITGILATITSLFISGNSIRKFGWTFTAMITPTVLLITSLGFFSFFFLKEYPEITRNFFNFAPLTLVVFFGSMQNCMSRAAKYTVFDATKEMAFVPLPPADKIKGKAAIDGICNRLGKSGGSVIYQALLLACSTITACVPYVAAILFAIIAIWIISVQSLGRKFQALTSQPESPGMAQASS